MILKHTSLRPIPGFLLPFTQSTSIQTRRLHKRIALPPIPRPTPFIPDVQTFLTVIGRGLSQHASKITSWKALFSLTSEQLQELGIEPPRTRRYLSRWCHRFRNGQYGVGGDFQHVKDGVAELRVVEVPSGHRIATATQTPNTRKIVVNVDADGNVLKRSPEQLAPAKGLHVQAAKTIVGPHVQPIKGGMGAKIMVKEGMWEDRRGHKIDGGERFRAERRAKRRTEERKTR